MTQSTIRVEVDALVELKTVDDTHKISWKQGVTGSCEFIASAIVNGDMLALSIEEMPYELNAKNRKTSVVLQQPAVWALRELLTDAYGQPDPKTNEQFAALVHLREELRTHIDSFREGLETAAKLDSNPDNRAYWKHEVKALGDIEAALKKTLQ